MRIIASSTYYVDIHNDRDRDFVRKETEFRIQTSKSENPERIEPNTNTPAAGYFMFFKNKPEARA